MWLSACGPDVGISENARCDGVLQPGEETVDEPFDGDGDGYYDAGNPDCAATWPAHSLDCDDNDPDVNPGAEEIACNEIDDDCDPSSVDDDGTGCGASFSGTWTLNQTVAMSCAFGNVVIGFDRLIAEHVDPNLTLTATGTGVQPGSLQGSVSSDGQFTSARAISGGCTESYTINGRFTSASTMEGTFSASFSGGLNCVDCGAFSSSFTATR